MNRNEQIDFLIRCLDPQNSRFTELDPRLRLRALMNVWALSPLPDEYWKVQDGLLQAETQEKGVVTLQSLTPVQPNIYLWQGDITRLQAGAIVNAANSQLLGCFAPLHLCIDNAIHSAAGLQLRLACADIMHKQGHTEATGQAKITPAFNLPCDYVLHTVGPIIADKVTEQDKRLLADSYRHCLQTAKANGIESVAFCCISTGEFRFPNEAAAEIAVQTVQAFLADNTEMQVVFNVFKDRDLAAYQKLLC